MSDYTQEELAALRNYKHQESSDYTAEELEALNRFSNKKEKYLSKNPLNQILSEYSQEFKEAPHRANMLGRGSAAGILDLMKGISSYANKTSNAAGFPSDEKKGNDFYNDLIRKVLPQESANEPIAKYSRETAKIAPTFAIPGGPELNAAKGALSFIPKLGSLLKSMGYNIGVGEAISPVYNPDKSLSESYKEGAVPSILGAGITPAFATSKNILGSLFRHGGTESKEAFTRNINAAKEVGINDLPMGQAAGSPIISGIQAGELSSIPFSGMPEHFIEAGKKMKEKTREVMKSLDLLPKEDEEGRNPLKQILKSAQDNYKDKRNESSALFKERNDYIKSLGENISDRENIKNTATDMMNNIQQELKENPNTPVNPQLLKDLEDAGSANPMSFQRANPLKSRLKESAIKANKENDSFTQKAYERLLAAHSADMEKNLNRISEKHPEVKELNNKANQHFSEWIAPVKNSKLLNKYLSGRGEAETLIPAFTKGGNDRPDLQAQIFKYISPDEQKQYAKEFLSKFDKEGYQGESKLEEDALLRGYGKIGNETKKVLFQNSPEEKNTLDALNHVKDLYKSDINQLLNVKSGEKSAKQLARWASLGSFGTIPLGANIASNYLRSDAAKKSYLKGLKMKGKSTKNPANSSAILTALFGGDDSQ